MAKAADAITDEDEDEDDYLQASNNDVACPAGSAFETPWNSL